MTGLTCEKCIRSLVSNGATPLHQLTDTSKIELMAGQCCVCLTNYTEETLWGYPLEENMEIVKKVFGETPFENDFHCLLGCFNSPSEAIPRLMNGERWISDLPPVPDGTPSNLKVVDERMKSEGFCRDSDWELGNNEKYGTVLYCKMKLMERWSAEPEGEKALIHAKAVLVGTEYHVIEAGDCTEGEHDFIFKPNDGMIVEVFTLRLATTGVWYLVDMELAEYSKRIMVGYLTAAEAWLKENIEVDMEEGKVKSIALIF